MPRTIVPGDRFVVILVAERGVERIADELAETNSYPEAVRVLDGIGSLIMGPAGAREDRRGSETTWTLDRWTWRGMIAKRFR